MEVCERKIKKPLIRPKPAYLGLGGGGRGAERPWARRLRLSLAADIVQGRCRATETSIALIDTHFVVVTLNGKDGRASHAHLGYEMPLRKLE